MLKQVCGVKTNTINLSTFEGYFESINNPRDTFFFNPEEDILYLNEYFAKHEFQGGAGGGLLIVCLYFMNLSYITYDNQ